MSRLALGVLVLSAIVASCQCGSGPLVLGDPCNRTEECPQDSHCTESRCVALDGIQGDGGEETDGGYVPPCTTLRCRQISCTNGGTTTLSGSVYTPKGDLPLYGATVYVPNGAVQPFTAGVSCDQCAAASGDPLVSTTTGPDGTFILANVPTGADIPLVIQLGRWRRQVTIPSVTGCQANPITNVELLRLPRNRDEGDIPKMAIATGSADPFECLLRKVGLDDAEITEPDGDGRLHFYRGHNGKDVATTAPRSSALWGDLETLRQYDVLILPCEGVSNTTQVPKTTAAKQNIIDYTSAGGRVFATHYSYTWLQSAPAPFPSVATWNLSGEDPVSPYSNPFDVNVETNFQKGKAFADWLVNVEASSSHGLLTLRETRHNVDAVIPPRSQQWLYGYNSRESKNIVAHFTFNTPVLSTLDAGTENQCGRVVFSSFHVSANALDTSKTYFPEICKDDPPSAQEKALIFMLFDLSACVQRDDLPVIE